MKRYNKEAESRCKNALKTAKKNYTRIKSLKSLSVKAIRRDSRPRS